MPQGSEDTVSHNTFPLFSVLPQELRLCIWSHAFPDSRLVEVVWNHVRREWISPLAYLRQPNHAALANLEANRLFLEKWFQLPLRSSNNHTRHNPQRITYFNPELDVLYIGPSDSLPDDHFLAVIDDLAAIDCMRSVRVLACGVDELAEVFKENNELNFLAHFPRLVFLIIIQNDCGYSGLVNGTVGSSPMEVRLKAPSEMTGDNVNSRQSLALEIWQKLKDVSQAHPGANIPHVEIMDVLRGQESQTDVAS